MSKLPSRCATFEWVLTEGGTIRAALLLIFAACSIRDVSFFGPGVGSDGGGSQDDATTIDAPAGCVPGTTRCTNCSDDDGDGAIDSADIECSMPMDNDEASFGSGIPGDNIDPRLMDCFFDGNTGSGDDGCSVHVCCVLGITTAAQCPFTGYLPSTCPPPVGTASVPQTCTSFCGPKAPIGCDCFGCCTICDAAGACVDVATHPMTSPNCTAATTNDPQMCKPCSKIPSCGRPACGNNTCVLCPGQTEADLPASCSGVATCPPGVTKCSPTMTCPAGFYCDASSDCCIGFLPPP